MTRTITIGISRTLALLLLIYALLAASYSLRTPLFEAPDAHYHFAVIEHLARTGSWPPRDDVRDQPWQQMAYHAPLYHRVAAWIIAPVDTSDFYARFPRNPHARIGEPSALDNVNFVAHAGDSWRGAGLAARLVRGWSLLLGAVTVAGVYGLGRLLFPARPALAIIAALMVTLNSQFLFISGAINNDNLVTALATLALLVLIRIVKRGVDWWWLSALSLTLGLAALAKASGLALYPVAMAGMLYVCWRDGVPLRRMAAYAALGLAAFVLIAGWWYADNWRQFGDPTASAQVALATAPRTGPVDWPGELRGLLYSFWGLFGWFNVLAPGILYTWAALLLALAALGGVWQMIRRPALPHRDDLVCAGLLALYVALVIGAWAQFNTQVQAGQGRLWFPLLGVIGCAVAWGLAAWRWLAPALLAPLGFAALILPHAIIAPAYAPTPPQPVEAWQPPLDAVAVPLREPWQDAPCLVLWVAPPVWPDGAESLTLDLAWEMRCAFSGYWSVFVHFSDLTQETCEAGDTRHILSQFDSMPDGGRTPFPAMRPGYVLADAARVAVPDGIDLEREWHLQVGLYDAGGTFMRAFVGVDDADAVALLSAESSRVTVGRCSPELVNVSIRRTAAD